MSILFKDAGLIKALCTMHFTSDCTSSKKEVIKYNSYEKGILSDPSCFSHFIK